MLITLVLTEIADEFSLSTVQAASLASGALTASPADVPDKPPIAPLTVTHA